MAETFQPWRRGNASSTAARPTHPVIPVDGSWWSEHDLDSTTGSEGGGQSVGHGEVGTSITVSTETWFNRLFSARTVARTQGIYYSMIALWSLLAPRTFNIVVWQNDAWLARLAGGLLGVVALALLYTTRAADKAKDGCVLGIASGVMLTILNMALLAEPNMSRIHLVDLGLELTWLTWWMAAMLGLPNEAERRASHFHQIPQSSMPPPVVDEPEYH